MIPSTNSSTQVRFNYINYPASQHQVPLFQKFSNSPIKIEDNLKNSEQKPFTFQACSSLQLETCKNFRPENQVSQKSLKSLDGIEKVQSNVMLQAQQSLYRAEQLDPVPETTSSRMSIPILKMESIQDLPQKFKFQQLQQIRQSDFFNQNKNASHQANQSAKSTQQINQNYSSNPYSNLNVRGGQPQQGQYAANSPQGKRSAKQVKTFKIDKIEERKESEFTGCCGFSLSDKVSFLSKNK